MEVKDKNWHSKGSLQKSQFLVLDEATSALDSQNEKIIIENILKYVKNITILLVTHRLETLKYCNRVLKIDKYKTIEVTNKNQI